MNNNNDNDNKTETDTEKLKFEQVHLEPIIAVFSHKNQYFVATPDTISEEYKQALGALLNKIFEDTPQMFEELKTLINHKDFDNKVN